MDEVGFSVIGLGMGRSRASQVVKTEGARLVSVIDLQAELAEQVAGELSCQWSSRFEDALDDRDVDVVFIVTPSGVHGQMAIQSLEAGKHTITTKPMEVTVEKCDAMLVAQEQSGQLLAVDFQQRFDDVYTKAKYAIEHGLFGRLLMGEARLKWYRAQSYYDKGGWRGTWKLDGGGSLANQTIHEIDLLRWLMGKPRTVIGKIACLNHDIETEDCGLAMIEFESGAVGTILGTTTFVTSVYSGLEIHGTEGALVTTQNTGADQKDARWFFSEGLEDRIEQAQRGIPYKNTVENMVAAVREGAELVCDGHEGRASTEMLCAIYESARNGSRVVELSSA